MSMVHVYLKHLTPGARKGSGGQAVRYLERTGEYAPDAATLVGYHERTAGKWKELDDLRHREAVNLPGWTGGSRERFFEASYQHERANGRWATSVQANFPRELSRDQQIAMARSFIETVYPDRPALWVIHEPTSQSDGLPQPHMHLLVSERIVNDGIPERPEAQMFKRWNADQPERGGCRKPTFGEGDRHAVYRLREAWCASANVALEMAGSTDRMDPRSFHTRGITRQEVRTQEYGPEGLETLLVDERTPETNVHERQLAAEWWDGYKRSMGIDLERMPQREAIRLIAREVREPGSRAAELARERSREPVARTRETPLDQPLIGNVRSKIYHVPGDPSYGEVSGKSRVVFATAAAAEEAGYRRARNQHYAVAGREQREEQGRTLAHLEDYHERLGAELTVARWHETEGRVRSPAGVRQTERLLAEAREYGMAPERSAAEREARLVLPLVGNRESRIYHNPGDPNYGDVVPSRQVLFWSHADAERAGYREAVNQHYGRGAEVPTPQNATAPSVPERPRRQGKVPMRERLAALAAEHEEGIQRGGLKVKLFDEERERGGYGR